MPVVCSALSYAHSKFGSAVEMMAWSDRPLRARIVLAYEEFHPVGLDMEGVPESIVTAFRALKARLTWAEAKGGEGSLEATLKLVSDAECRRIAGMITGLFWDLNTEYQRALVAEARLEAKRT